MLFNVTSRFADSFASFAHSLAHFSCSFACFSHSFARFPPSFARFTLSFASFARWLFVNKVYYNLVVCKVIKRKQLSKMYLWTRACVKVYLKATKFTNLALQNVCILCTVFYSVFGVTCTIQERMYWCVCHAFPFPRCGGVHHYGWSRSFALKSEEYSLKPVMYTEGETCS